MLKNYQIRFILPIRVWVSSNLFQISPYSHPFKERVLGFNLLVFLIPNPFTSTPYLIGIYYRVQRDKGTIVYEKYRLQECLITYTFTLHYWFGDLVIDYSVGKQTATNPSITKGVCQIKHSSSNTSTSTMYKCFYRYKE